MVFAKKKYGQNFLIDQNIISQIINEIKISNNNHYLEIGPGRGALTVHLNKKIKNLTLIEVDEDMIPILEKINPQNFNLIHNDILKLDEKFFSNFQTIIGNLPYYISTEIIFKFLAISNIQTMYFMLQKEVADRITASKGSKNNCILTNLISFHFDSEILIKVPPQSFDPVPKINSSFIKLTRHERFNRNYSYDSFKTAVKESFKFKRKNLKNNLKTIVDNEKLSSIDINPLDRAENLSIKDFIKIGEMIEKDVI
jgi:16S rRNA (adenine1518-N6/adenine1519-N6)-dimethyltransferase